MQAATRVVFDAVADVRERRDATSTNTTVPRRMTTGCRRPSTHASRDDDGHHRDDDEHHRDDDGHLCGPP